MGKDNSDGISSYERAALIMVWVGFVIVLIATFIYFFEFTFKFFSPRFGQYGEFLGGSVGSIWSLAGVILFYDSLRNQRQELKMQRHELQLQRHEIIEQTEQIKRQNETLEIQTLENTFFQLIMLHNEIVETIDLEVHQISLGNTEMEIKKAVGRDSFVEYYQIYKRCFHTSLEKAAPQEFTHETLKLLVDYSFREFFNEHQSNLGHYFRNLYIIFSFIDSKIQKDKSFYVGLIRAQLSNYELKLLYFFCLSDKNPLFKPLAEKYSLFHHLAEDELIEITKELYNKSAFT